MIAMYGRHHLAMAIQGQGVCMGAHAHGGTA